MFSEFCQQRSVGAMLQDGVMVRKRTVWVIRFYLPSEQSLNQEFEKVNKKILLGILCIAVVAIAGASVLADTYKSKTVRFYVNSGGSQDICLFDDCWALRKATDWHQPVTEGNTYEYALYVLNTGTEMVYITYLPTDVKKD